MNSKSDQTQKGQRRGAKEPNLGQKEARIERESERDLRRMGELTSDKRGTGEKKKG